MLGEHAVSNKRMIIKMNSLFRFIIVWDFKQNSQKPQFGGQDAFSKSLKHTPKEEKSPI
jgi:hypothetical protein